MSPAALSEKITATVVPDTVILEVSATDPDPKQAQRIGQAVAKDRAASAAARTAGDTTSL